MWKQPVQQQLKQIEPICCSQKFTKIIQNNFSIFNILFFQFTAMIFYSVIILRSNGFLNLSQTFFSIVGMFVSFCWCGRFSGAILNPAIVMAHLVKKQNRMSLKIAAIYLIPQFLGALLGSFIGWQFFQSSLLAPFTVQVPAYGYVGLVFLKEVIGSFFYSIVVLIFISSDITFAQIDIQIWLSLSLILTTVCQITNSPYGVNPAFALSFQLWFSVYNQAFFTMQYCWSTIIGPLVGGLLGSIFFQFVYRPLARLYKDQFQQDQKIYQRRVSQLTERTNQYTLRRTSILNFT